MTDSFEALVHADGQRFGRSRDESVITVAGKLWFDSFHHVEAIEKLAVPKGCLLRFFGGFQEPSKEAYAALELELAQKVRDLRDAAEFLKQEIAACVLVQRQLDIRACGSYEMARPSRC